MENQNENLIYHLSPRRLYSTYITTGIIAFIFLIIGIFFPLKGVPVFESGFTSIVIGKLFVIIICLIGILICGLMAWLQKNRSDTYVIKLSDNSVDFTFGVFSRKTEDIEMHSIHDVIYRQGPFDLMFKTADIIIYSHDFTTPVIKFDGLSIEDAHDIHQYISDHGSDSLVKYYNKTGTMPAKPQTIPTPQTVTQEPTETIVPTVTTPPVITDTQIPILTPPVITEQ